MTDAGLVGLLELLGHADGALRQLATKLRGASGVSLVERRCDIQSEPIPSIEWFVDAELEGGDALSWHLLVYNRESEWTIESELRRVHTQGSDLEVGLPTRYALDDDLEDELKSATRQLLATANDRIQPPGG